MNLQEIEITVEKVAHDWNVPGLSVAIVQGDEIIYAKSGVCTLGEPAPVDEHTVFAIASNTKAFTAAALAVLVDEERLKLDDPVSDYLPEFQLYDPYATRELTVRDLLCHRSGLATFSGDLLWCGTTYTSDEVLRRARYLKPVFSFRAGFGYQNILFMAAGKIVEVVSGQSWSEFIRSRFLTPLGMDRTTTSVSELAGMENVSAPHAVRGGRLQPISYLNIDNELPAGGINSSAADLAEWLRLQLGKGQHRGRQLISAKMVGELWTPHTLLPIDEQTARLYPSTHFQAYGLGWFLCDYHGRKVIEHSGGLPGMVSQVVVVPEERLGLAILTNSETSAARVLRGTLLDLAFGAPARDWSAEYQAVQEKEAEAKRAAERKLQEERVHDTRPSLPLEAYAGRYTGRMYGEVEVGLESGSLALNLLPAPDMSGDLEHWHYDTFRLTWRDGSLPPGMATFTLDAHGRPAELKLDVPNRDFDFKELELKRQYISP